MSEPLRADPRRRRLAAFVRATTVWCVLATVACLVTGNHLHAVTSALVATAGLLSMAALRRGSSTGPVAAGFLSAGLVAAVLTGIDSGSGGLVATFWLIAAPVFALATGGRKAGAVILVLTLVAIAVIGIAVDHDLVLATHRDEPNAVSFWLSINGACALLFLVALSHETEVEATFQRLLLQRSELLAARADAERASRARRDFLATISHELRTPLNGVTGLATLLGSETSPQRAREGMRLLRQSADALLGVVNNVLDFSKFESGALELEALPMSPAREVSAAVEALRPQASEQHDTLTLEISPEVPAFVRADPTRLRQVVSHLVSNAIKFTTNGAVSVRLHHEPHGLQLTVRDTGVGMSAEVQARLFQPFSQGDSSTTRAFGGSGLGLVLTRKLLDAQGGRLRVTSAPDQGTCVVVELPCEPTTGPSETDGKAAPRRSVLLVEDNFVNQLVCRRLLEHLGHEVTLADDGEAAVALASARAFDLVLMDCHMPKVDGYEATRRLRALGYARPIHALTASVEPQELARCRTAGMDGLLAKPLQLDRLEAVLAQPMRSA